MKIDDDLLPDERALLEGKTITSTPAEESTDEQTADEGVAAEADQAKAAAAENETVDAEALAAVAGEDDEPAEPAAYEVPTTDFKAERVKLAEQEAAVQQKWADGGLSDEERDTEVAKLRDTRDAILTQEVEARTIENINRQNTIRSQKSVLAQIKAESAAAKQIDYNEQKNGVAFDNMLTAVIGDPDNQGKSFAELAKLAHDALCAARGVKAAKAASATAADAADKAAVKPTAAKPNPRANVPPTLASMPVASASPVGSDFLTTLSAMNDPDAAEAALAALPKATRDAHLRQTIPAGRR